MDLDYINVFRDPVSLLHERALHLIFLCSYQRHNSYCATKLLMPYARVGDAHTTHVQSGQREEYLQMGAKSSASCNRGVIDHMLLLLWGSCNRGDCYVVACVARCQTTISTRSTYQLMLRIASRLPRLSGCVHRAAYKSHGLRHDLPRVRTS